MGEPAAGSQPADSVESGQEGTEYVRWVQDSLNRILGLRLPLNGIMRPETRSAIRSFQVREKLPVTGLVGPDTERVLIDATKRTASSTSELGSFDRTFTVRNGEAEVTIGKGALATLRPFAAPSTKATVDNALQIIRAVSSYYEIPWKIGYAILQHEGGVRLFNHPDGVMQTTTAARRTTIPRIPRVLKLTLLGLPPTDSTPDRLLTQRVNEGFGTRLAIQIATGLQMLKDNLQKFSGYVSLAFQAYNAGARWAYYTASRRKYQVRPSTIQDSEWEDMCRFGASLLHQPAQRLRVEAGTWQCDANIPAWFSHIRVYDRTTGLQLIAFKYLRSIRQCVRHKPKTHCTSNLHKRREAGSGPETCSKTRPGSLDKIYNPKLLGAKYYEAVKAEWLPIQDDGLPLKAVRGRLIKRPQKV